MRLIQLQQMLQPQEYNTPNAYSPYLSPTKPLYCSLSLAGLILLADLRTLAARTALTGTSCFLDIFILCPGLHSQQRASELHNSEYPATAAMTTGYPFRVENEATVVYLQKMGLAGHLTTLHVRAIDPGDRPAVSWSRKALRAIYDFNASSLVSSLCYFLALTLTLATFTLLIIHNDRWAVSTILLLIAARTLNVLTLRSRASTEWKGAPEPGVSGDLIILLSQDRWLRMRGLVDDLKAVTSGQWLRDPSLLERSATGLATIMVYFSVAVLSNASQLGVALSVGLGVVSAGLMAVANEWTSKLKMYGRVVEVVGQPKGYDRRRVLVDELIAETGREDWAKALGMIPGGPVAMM